MKNKKNQKATPAASGSNRNLGAKIYKYRGFYLMFLPVFVFAIIFFYLPMLGVRYAFTNYNGMVVQTIIYLPHFMSWVVTASIFSLILAPTGQGLVNSFLVNIGVLDSSNMIYFLGNPKTWRATYYIINIWKGTGWQTVIFMATLAGINTELYEAAAIDGAGRWGKMRYITFPALQNTILTVFILNLAKVMNLFIQFGHNDEKKADPSRYTAPFGAYMENLENFIQTARNKKAYPVLITPLERRCFTESGQLGVGEHSDYVAAMKQTAEKLNVPLIDLYSMSRTELRKAGVEKTREWYMVGVLQEA